MEKSKNLCAKIPGSLYIRAGEEKEQMGLNFNEYVEKILREHFEGGTAMAEGKRTLAFEVSEELFTRIKRHLKRTGQTQKAFVLGLIEKALQDAEKEETREDSRECVQEGEQEESEVK